MPIVIHTTLEDTDIKKAVKEAVVGEIEGLTREALSEIIGLVVNEKVTVNLSQDKIVAVAREVVRQKIEKFLGSGYEITPTASNNWFTQVVRQEVNRVIDERLRRGKLLG